MHLIHTLDARTFSRFLKTMGLSPVSSLLVPSMKVEGIASEEVEEEDEDVEDTKANTPTRR